MFGGGHLHKKRFNDTLKIQLPYFEERQQQAQSKFSFNLSGCRRSNNNGLKQTTVHVTQFVSPDHNSSMNFPCPRTYHASTLIDRFMVICGGESSSNTDLNDFWALDLQNEVWYSPIVEGLDSFVPKRFHSANCIKQTQVVTFGGCHSEYVHLNDLNIFELKDFINNPETGIVTCTKVIAIKNLPSSRWGHAAVVHDQTQLLILGGRNENDVSDICCFDSVNLEWSYLQIGAGAPQPRRRHSAVLLSNCIMMFGGFDGEFFDDLHILDLLPDANKVLISPSTRAADLVSTINSPNNYNVVFKLIGPTGFRTLNALKAMLLYRLIELERLELSSFQPRPKNSSVVHSVANHPHCP